jgi:predicted Zn-dependent protease
MKKYSILLTGVLIFSLSGCATQQMQTQWDAAKIGNSSSVRVNLADKKGEVLASVKPYEVRVAIAAKNKVEETAGPLRAKLLIDADESPNAYAWYNDGQPSITINVGMFRILDGDEEAYAALYGHELAHLYLGHNAKAAQRNSAKQVGSNVLGVALGLAGIPFGGSLADVATSAIATVYSRDDEREADTQGMKYIVQAGYDPYGAVRLQEKLKSAGGSAQIPFLSSHPSGDERIENMKKLAAMVKATPPNAHGNYRTNDGENGSLNKLITVQGQAETVQQDQTHEVRSSNDAR